MNQARCPAAWLSLNGPAGPQLLGPDDPASRQLRMPRPVPASFPMRSATNIAFCADCVQEIASAKFSNQQEACVDRFWTVCAKTAPAAMTWKVELEVETFRSNRAHLFSFPVSRFFWHTQKPHERGRPAAIYARHITFRGMRIPSASSNHPSPD